MRSIQFPMEAAYIMHLYKLLHMLIVRCLKMFDRSSMVCKETNVSTEVSLWARFLLWKLYGPPYVWFSGNSVDRALTTSLSYSGASCVDHIALDSNTLLIIVGPKFMRRWTAPVASAMILQWRTTRLKEKIQIIKTSLMRRIVMI